MFQVLSHAFLIIVMAALLNSVKNSKDVWQKLTCIIILIVLAAIIQIFS